MGVFGKYTKKSLFNNRVRTIVTIIGIVLSVSLFTAVAEGLISVKEYAVERVYQTLGHFEGAIESDDSAVIDKIKNEQKINSMRMLQDIGFSYIGSENVYKPYLYVGAMSKDFTDLVAVKLKEGKMPENSGEIILPLHLKFNGGVEYKIGDTVSVETGKRMFEGVKVSRDSEYIPGETLSDVTGHTYTVVGFYERFNYDIESYSSPGYMALTCMDDVQENEDFKGIIFFTMENQKDVNTFVESFGEEVDSIINNELLLYNSGITMDGGILSMLTGFACVLFIIIMFGCVALIYNSFSISVSERTKQFGILKSVGATKKQIMGTVLYEVLFLCIIAIPLGYFIGCAGIGVTLYLLRDSFIAIMDDIAGGDGLFLSLHMKFSVFVFVAAMGLFTTFISAIVPALRAIRIMPIDSLRQSRDVNINARKVKTSKLTYKLFGFPGMLASKNFKRSRRKYRATVLSLFVSVVLFISASSFSSYLMNVAGVVTTTSDYDIKFVTGANMDGEDIRGGNFDKVYEEFEKELQRIDGVESTVKVIEKQLSAGKSLVVEPDMLTEDFRPDEVFSGDSESPDFDKEKYVYEKNKNLLDVCIYFLEDSVYENLLKENNIEIPGDGRIYGVLWDEYIRADSEDNSTQWSRGHIFEKKNYPVSLKLQELKHIDGYDYAYTDYETGEDGNITEKNYYYDINSESDSEESYIALSSEEAVCFTEINIAGVFDTVPAGMMDSPAVIYPKSTLEQFAPDYEEWYDVTYYVTADNHNFVADKMHNIMTENLSDEGISSYGINDVRAEEDRMRSMVIVINVFAYGFIILISLVAITNIFNTISTNIMIRKREFAMLKSTGMSDKKMMKMMNYECILYGIKGIIYGIPVSCLISYFLYRWIRQGVSMGFYIPWYSIAISVGSVFVVVFATMLYSMNKIKKDNIVETLRNENI